MFPTFIIAVNVHPQWVKRFYDKDPLRKPSRNGFGSSVGNTFFIIASFPLSGPRILLQSGFTFNSIPQTTD